MFYTSCGIDKKTSKGWRGYLLYKDEEGKAKKKYKTFNTKYNRDAKKLVNEWRDYEEELKKRDVQYTTVEKALRDYVESQYALGRIDTVTYQRNIRQGEYAIFPYIGEENFYEITSEILQKWINTLAKRYAMSSVQGYYAIFNKAYKAAFHQGKIIKDARAGLIMPRNTSKHKIAYLDNEGLNKLYSLIDGGEILGAKNNDLYIPICLALYGGLRAGEVCALRWEDINLTTNNIYITKAEKQIKDKEGRNIVVEGDTKTYSRRTVPMMPQLRGALIEEQRKTRPNDKNYVCHWRNPRHLGSAFQKWAGRNKVDSVLGKPITFHGLRHTFATLGVKSKMDIKSLASILGHKDAAMTLNIYASDDEQAKQINIQNLGNLFAEKQDSDF